ncbi:FG-GAP repeat protein [Leptospira kirschneri str. 2008720114]|uniref:FG-GAP-like repeat-containing protein n=1 Tax=Leptospira kirschneri TaxID=29507 RepID=UPI0002985078|nr:FG-GAP-like repeat-containing protein [Leptospira kirschneri]EKP05854.1 FG-GAP repeat protein [Leptospira kirschneri str. 2008720114]
MKRFLFLLYIFLLFQNCSAKSTENPCDTSTSLFYKSLFLNFILTSGKTSFCGIHTSVQLPPPTILNIKSKSTLNTGFLIGEMDESVSGVQVSLDSGPFMEAQISGNQWKFQLPAAGVSTTVPSNGIWKDWSLHTISVRSTSKESNSVPITITVQKGSNKDINGDGYPDALIGSQVANRVRAYLSLGKARGLNLVPITLLNGAGGFGYSVKLGDIDGDGYADAVVGSATNTFAIYLGSTSGLSTTAINYIPIGVGGLLNVDVGDINGDGFSDVLVGAPYDVGNIGRVYSYFSNGAVGQGVTFGQQLNNPGNAGSTTFYGYAITLGDINGDGRSDAIIGAVGSGQIGASFVYLAQAAGAFAAYSQTITGSAANEWYANSAIATDINRDGFADLFVGAYQESGGGGRVHLYLSNLGILANTANGPISGLAGSQTGTSVATGDVNGDGFLDLLTGGYSYTSTLPNQGYAITHLTTGDTIGLTVNPLNLLTVPVNLGDMGNSIASVDINGDGLSDVLVGAPSSVGGTNIGNVYLYISDGLGGYTSAPQTFVEPDVNGTFGTSVDL